jgi:DNA repair exonuclease SbcCD ATPase subunit
MDFTELIDKEKLYLQLKTLVSKNGFPLFLLKQYIPFITTGINAFISHFIDRRIDIEILGDHIYINSWEGKTCINVLSGAEEFLYELGFKFVFSTLAQLPQSNILFIDEQLGCLDAKKMREFEKVTEFLKKNYSLSFIISHIGTVQNYINYNININKVGNKSRLST